MGVVDGGQNGFDNASADGKAFLQSGLPQWPPATGKEISRPVNGNNSSSSSSSSTQTETAAATTNGNKKEPRSPSLLEPSICSPNASGTDQGFSSSTSFDNGSNNAVHNRKKFRSRTMPVFGAAAAADPLMAGRRSRPLNQETGGPQSRAHAKIHAYADATNAQKFPRISRPVELMGTSYDCVVIGSGYGGGVAAARMARAGQSVCLLELGKERWPGEYPTSTGEAFEELHCSGELAPLSFLNNAINVDTGRPTGMYHLVFGKGQNTMVCNGLGGTSLINANVFLRADEGTMGMKAWPPELREKGALDDYYNKVERVLEPESYPEDWPSLPKLDLLQKQADALNMKDKFSRVKQTTRFRNGPNSCGVEMSASALTGQDATGVNDGSKTTTLVTYLADAWNWGAELFCECEVRYIEKVQDSRGGYRVYFAWHGCNRGHFKANLHGDLMWVHAREAVFLGAGALGTTEILLRSKTMGLGLSDMVGQNMSGNGDILAFGYNTDHLTNSIGRPYPSPYNPIGPTITGIIDNRTGHDNPLDGYVIEEGAVPHALAHFLQSMLDLLPGAQPPKNETLVQRTQATLARWGSRLLGPYFRGGALEKTQVYLIMSHDSNQAILSLKNDKPVLEFLGVGRSDHVKYLDGILAKATQAVGGTLVANPFSALMDQQITVHPIGGAAMARDNTGATGATDHIGRLFTGNGSEVHAGLIVTDGSAIPTALGVNPFATITALAERSVHLYAKSRGLVIRTDDNGILNLFGRPAHHPKLHGTASEDSFSTDDDTNSMGVTAYEEMRNEIGADAEAEAEAESVHDAHQIIDRAAALRAGGFGFSEVMSGFLHRDAHMHEDTQDAYQQAYRTAHSLCESARFFLSVQAFDTNDLVNDPNHKGMLTGTFVCPTLPGSPFMVQRGAFNLFVVDHQAPGTRNLTYDFDMRGTDGRTLHFHGYKVVDSSVALAPLQLWRATTTLYVTITHKRILGKLESGGLLLPPNEPDEAWRYEPVMAKGIMHIKPADFLSEVLTMTPTGSSLLRKVVSAASFMTYFTRKSLDLFLAPLTQLQYPTQTYSGYINNTPPTRVWTDIRASDGVYSRLYMWEPLPAYVPRRADGRPGEAKNLFFIPGASVDHQIYALPTIPFNTVNYFNRAGYRVFVCVLRIGQLMIAENNWTTFDARLDIRAALERIRSEYCGGGGGGGGIGGNVVPSKVYTVAHCMGSVALATGLLDGTIPADWLLGLSCSQVFMNPIWNTMNMLKALAGPVPMDTLYKALAGTWFNCSTSPDDALVQRALNQALRLLPDARKELCNNAACHRISLVFGRCWNHGNLNEATHRQIDRFFGGVNMTMLHLLMLQGSQGHVMSNGPLFEVLTTPANVQARLRGLPVFLFVGGDNAVLSPRATEKTYEILCDTFGSAGPAGFQEGVEYRRRVIPGYGHLDCWMGRNAWKDVYPVLRAEVDRVVHGASYQFKEPDARVCRFTRMMEAGEL
ncbi:glucose-methanol-choline oxidoreductase [Niveomyces insectorum RCEF 264]|uniref:Cholesterol oxidase n=1 Tax=Niveomyces insectorum RCEF 264 TaxID=1081102 RepID=A0A167RV21_9HYPO|nr:glucose-methanol-choline oxidoreductase [Niveomyces insectorum RCEF 264]